MTSVGGIDLTLLDCLTPLGPMTPSLFLLLTQTFLNPVRGGPYILEKAEGVSTYKHWKCIVQKFKITTAASKHLKYLVPHPPPPAKVEDAPQLLWVSAPPLSLYHHLHHQAPQC